MKYTYRINKEEGIIYQTYKGIITIDDLKACRTELISDSDFNPKDDFLSDMRGCQFNFEPDDAAIYAKFIKPKMIGYKIKSALIIDNPYETALVMLFQDYARNIRIAKVFSTYEAAIKWLKEK